MTTTALGSTPTAVAGGGRIRLPSSRRRAHRMVDLLDASYGDLRPPLQKAVDGSWPLTVQLRVRTSGRHGVLREAMRARDASGRTLLESARANASMPPDEAETEGAWVWRWDVAAGGAGANWATFLHLLERTTATANVARDSSTSSAALSMRVGGVSLCSERQTERDQKIEKNFFALDSRQPVIQTQQPSKNTCTQHRR